MKKQVILAGLLAATLAMPLAACGGSSAGTSTSGDSGTTTTSAQSSAGTSTSGDSGTTTTSAQSSAGTSTSGDSGTTTTSAQSSDFDANKFYAGQWRGSVEMTGQTVYGTAGGFEQMLDVNFADDGTCTVEPLEAHADLLNDKGTWEGTADEVILHLEKAGDITLKVTGKANLEGDAHAFDIADFDVIQFDFYG